MGNHERTSFNMTGNGATAPKGCFLKRLNAVHPEAETLTGVLKHLGADIE
jgi:hypothetical protein